MPQPKMLFLVCLLAYTALLRLLPYILMNCDLQMNSTVLYYPWNFNPLTAACLFGGACLADRRRALLVPLVTLFVSDLGIWALTGRAEWAFSGVTYLMFSVAAIMGFALRNSVQRRVMGRAILLGISFEVLFYFVSNYFVWAGSSTMTPVLYPDTTEGLVACYLAGLPFFGKSLLGTIAFTTLLFSPLGVRASTEENASDQGALVPRLSRVNSD